MKVESSNHINSQKVYRSQPQTLIMAVAEKSQVQDSAKEYLKVHQHKDLEFMYDLKN
jgi:hypothetical protein